MEERVPQNHQEQQAHDPNPQEQHAFEHEGSVHGDEQLGLTMGEYTLPFVGNVPTAIVLDDVARQGTIADKRATEAYDILEKIAQNSQQKTSNVRKGGRLDVGLDTQVQIQMSRMNKELQSIKDLITGKPRHSHRNKGKSPSTDEHINVLEVVEEEVKNVIGPEIVPKQVRVLDHSTKVEVDNLEKGLKNEEREKGEDFPIKLTNPGSFMIGVTI
ncbi:hypothetical protein LWI29_012735 [Acer saccharum]|uniref:Uncharacterized protein n=1 Tax=Acer saccharum TaxID=4024 RepID=A0AA39W367_ACESA|nr:hypothetical protein LWI29_012735 [Acer saccharum]